MIRPIPDDTPSLHHKIKQSIKLGGASTERAATNHTKHSTSWKLIAHLLDRINMSKSSSIVLISGANSGIGFAASGVIAKASEGYHVIMASRNAENGEKALAEVKAMEGIKGSLSTIQLDQDDPASIKRAAQEIETQFGRLDVLVNNAAIGVYQVMICQMAQC